MANTPLPMVLLATSGDGLTRAKGAGERWQVQHVLAGQRFNCVAADPGRPGVVYAGAEAGTVLRSSDAGHTWQSVGRMDGFAIKSLSVSRAELGALYAGTQPPAVFVSRDEGQHWRELEGFRRVRRWWWRSPAVGPPFTAYVQGLALSPIDPSVIVAGIEAGAVVRSEDGGQSWQDHRPGALRDCHSIVFHDRDGQWAYEAGGSGAGAAFSRDGGRTWQQTRAGLDRNYGWAVAADPERPEIWYVSASQAFTRATGPVPAAHVDGKASAAIFRWSAAGAWERLSGGLPEPLDYMAYALLTDPRAPGHVYAGLSNGQVWHSTDYGASWRQLPCNVRRVERAMALLPIDDPGQLS